MDMNQSPAKENIMPKDPTNKLPTKIRIMLWLTIVAFIASCVVITITITDGNPYAFCAFIITGIFSLITCHYAEMWYRIHKAAHTAKQ